MTSTAESKCVFKSQTALKWRWTNVQCNVCFKLIWCIYRYIFLLNTRSGGKICLVAPGVVVPPWATETVLSPLVGGWWGQSIARAFTRCMMKILKKTEWIYIYIYIYVCVCVCVCILFFYLVFIVVSMVSIRYRFYKHLFLIGLQVPLQTKILKSYPMPPCY